ncbi:zinc finger CCCH domain-containing protein 15 homolog [Lutzomyia longipalpis]|uniref:zinc finger CCCH domain-containing protein 15 homolog n=1 Tax=Lutzomyia longipalpis TaxID=7200 RepID=UPI0024846F1B|nr:zinc finger CCCH domain-containing protein 15 homolog [Lutzomyia longipalpis]
MPPKKAQPTSSKKTEQKKKEKIIEDKTFGLKNKKGAKQQKFITQVEKQVKSGGQHPVAGANANVKKLEKERKQLEQKELAMLFKPVQTQKIEKGTDPKSVVCVFFKQGQCTKGDKCKFSHDLTVERKVEKRSLYVDMRDDMEGEETMENWNEEKLKEVVDKKHGKEKRMPTTDIICKYFLDAVEKYKYGWFWECPNGEKCIYRHALPAGYVLKRDKKILDQKKPDISLVDLIESERAALGPKQTKVTLESFIAWKKRKLEEKKEKIRKEEEKKRNEFKSGKNIGLSGREMFSFNPDLVNDGQMEDGDEAFDSYQREEEEEETGIEYHEIDFNSIELGEVDGTGTVASADRFHRLEEPSGQDEEEEEEDESSTEGAGAVDAAPINENLFLSEDLEGLDDELNELDIDK